MTPGLVSVIIVAHNRPDYLSQALASLLKQEDKAWEAVVVDCSSAPLAHVVAQAMGGRPFKYNYLPGMSEWPPRCSQSWNYGVRMSDGEFLAFLDDDDLKVDTFVGGMKSLLEKPDVDFAVCRGWVIDKNGQKTDPYMGMPFVEPARLRRGCINFLVTGQIIVRRRVFDEIGGFDECLPVSEDYEFAIRLLERKGVATGHILMLHRNHGENASVSPLARNDTQTALRYIIEKHKLTDLKCRGCGSSDGVEQMVIENRSSGWTFICDACRGAGREGPP